MKKSPIYTLILFVIGWNIIMTPILLISAKYRANRVLNPYVQEVITSSIINNEFGIVKKVKIKHIFNYTKRSMDHTCTEMKILTNNGEYLICKIVESKYQGYIYNKKLYEEKTSSSVIEIENYSADFDRELNAYLKKVIDYPNTREPIVRKIEDNKYQITNICKYRKEEECKDTNEKFLNSLITEFKNKYEVKLQND